MTSQASIHVYPSKNYSSVTSEFLSTPRPYSTTAISRRDEWLQKGMRKTLHLLLLAHDNGVPCVLVQRAASGYSCLEGVLEPGQSEEEAIKTILVRHLMKHSVSDRLEFSISDCVLQLWRPDFDDHLYPYLPGHVSRPKEQLRLVLVGLPPRAVLQLPPGVALDAVPLGELKRRGQAGFGSLLAAVPDVLSRTSLKMLVTQQ